MIILKIIVAIVIIHYVSKFLSRFLKVCSEAYDDKQIKDMLERAEIRQKERGRI